MKKEIFACLLVAGICSIIPHDVWADASDSATVNSEPVARPFPADRPGKASGPFTVDEGHYDIETDIINSTYDKSATTVSHGYFLADPLLKMGITHDADIELQLGGYQHFDFKDRANGAKTHTEGWGDETIRLKYNVIGDDGSAFGLAFLPSIKIPSATSTLKQAGITNNQVEGGLLVPMNYNLPDDYSVAYQAEFDVNKNAENGNDHASFVNIASVSHPLPGLRQTLFTVEFYSNVNGRQSPDDPNIYTLDPSITYQVTPDLVFDVETDIGLNRAATDLQTIFGVTKLF